MKKEINPYEPIRVNDDVWFYIGKKTLQFIVWMKETKDRPRGVREFRIKKSTLKPFV